MFRAEEPAVSWQRAALMTLIPSAANWIKPFASLISISKVSEFIER
jgi:hypothetical protein